jgi:hypothetical protein
MPRAGRTKGMQVCMHCNFHLESTSINSHAQYCFACPVGGKSLDLVRVVLHLATLPARIEPKPNLHVVRPTTPVCNFLGAHRDQVTPAVQSETQTRPIRKGLCPIPINRRCPKKIPERSWPPLRTAGPIPPRPTRPCTILTVTRKCSGVI